MSPTSGATSCDTTISSKPVCAASRAACRSWSGLRSPCRNAIATERSPSARASDSSASNETSSSGSSTTPVASTLSSASTTPGIQRGRQPYRAREDVRPILVTDAQRVTEAACRYQQGRLALALEQRVRGYRRAEPHRFQPPADARRALEDIVDGANRRVARAPGVARQDLVRVEVPVGIECDDVGERTAAVDRESPGLLRTIGHHRGTFARCAQARQTTGLCARATGR